MADEQPPNQPSIDSVSPQDQANREGEEPPKTPPPDTDAAPTNGRHNERKTCRPDQVPWWKYLIELAGVLTVVAYTIIANRQVVISAQQLAEIIKQYPEIKTSAQAAKDAADVNKEALYTVQRAYLTFSDAPEFVLANLPSGRVFMLGMPIQNDGATQAHGMKDRVSCVTPMTYLPKNYTFPDIHGGDEARCGIPWAATGANTLPPKGSTVSQSVMVDEKIVREFISQNSGPPNVRVMNHPSRQIYFYGWVTYYDIFKENPAHLTEFCRQLRILAIQPQGIQQSWMHCPVHNCTDNDCPD
jgi:hypothetical protein